MNFSNFKSHYISEEIQMNTNVQESLYWKSRANFLSCFLFFPFSEVGIRLILVLPNLIKQITCHWSPLLHSGTIFWDHISNFIIAQNICKFDQKLYEKFCENLYCTALLWPFYHVLWKKIIAQILFFLFVNFKQWLHHYIYYLTNSQIVCYFS